MQEEKNSFARIYDSHFERFLPRYAFFSFLGCFVLNCLVYWSTQFLMSESIHYNFTTEFDKSVPFVPEWVSIYILSFAFWIVNYTMVSRHENKEGWYKFVTADMTARIVCGIIFIAIPTTNVRPEIVGTGFWDMMMGLIYSLDQPYDLFPSIHCLASWMCFIGIRRNKEISTGYKIFSCIFAIAICASTQFTKQHYLVDVAGGIIVAEVCYFMAFRTKGFLKIMNIFDKLNEKVFGRANEEK